MDIGNQIRERRQKLGLSQDELARRLYVSRVTVSHWETSRTLPDVQSMLLLANLFGTTIDELVKGDVEEMREIVERNEQRKKVLAASLFAVEAAVVVVLAAAAIVGREYLEPALRLALAALVLASSVTMLAARRREVDAKAREAGELLGATSDIHERAPGPEDGANSMRIALGTFACLVAGIGALAAGSMLLEEREFIYLAVAMGAAGAFACSFCLGRYARPAWTAGIMPGLWVALAAAFSVTKGAIASPKIWLAVACGAVTLLVFWVDGRRRRR